MEKIITYKNLQSFAYVNDRLIQGPIKGIVLNFFGLGGMPMYNDSDESGKYYAQKNILYVVAYNNPWSWMNPQAIAYTDEILDVLFEQYTLSDKMPMVFTGFSMGGMAALVYTHYAKHTPKACVVNCPVCDMPYHFTEREDLPRTIYSAYFFENGSLQEVLCRFAPLHLAEAMPDIAYYVFHCDQDQAVNKEKHSDRFVKALSKHQIAYYEVKGPGHCDLGEEASAQFSRCILKELGVE